MTAPGAAPSGPAPAEPNAALYDALPYPELPHHRTHPDHLATVARVFGLAPPAVERARVLEIGCGTGGNLVPLAASFPDARFVGIDVSAQHVARGRAFADAVGARNVELRVADVLGFDPGGEPFDYVLCHGVDSWVDETRRQAILRLAGAALAPQGVACVSYNVYPGWHLGELLRGLFLLAVDRDAPPAAQVARARAFLDDLVAALDADDHRLPFLRDERQRLARAADAYLFHEYLAPVNQPFWFRDFLRDAAAHGLAYLGNGAPETMLPDLQPEPLAARLKACASMIEAQQLLDVLGNRRFRVTLLVPAAAPVDRNLGPERFASLSVRASLTPDPAPPALVARAFGAGGDRLVEPVCVQDEAGRSAAVSGAPVRLALSILGDEAPCALPFRALVERVAARLAALGAPVPATLERDLAAHLGRLWFAELVGFHTAPPPVTNAPGERPRASAVARDLALRGGAVTNQWHRTVWLDEADRALLARLDGTVRPSDDEERARVARFAARALLVG